MLQNFGKTTKRLRNQGGEATTIHFLTDILETNTEEGDCHKHRDGQHKQQKRQMETDRMENRYGRNKGKSKGTLIPM